MKSSHMVFGPQRAVQRAEAEMVGEQMTGRAKTTGCAKPAVIIIIDDNPRSLEYLSAALASEHTTIFTAPNGLQALDLIFKHRPHIVLSDLVMPGLSGLDVLQQVKSFDPAIDVILMSAHDSGGSRACALEHGATDFLRKPIPLAVLRSRIDRVIQNHISEEQL